MWRRVGMLLVVAAALALSGCSTANLTIVNATAETVIARVEIRTGLSAKLDLATGAHGGGGPRLKYREHRELRRKYRERRLEQKRYEKASIAAGRAKTFESSAHLVRYRIGPPGGPHQHFSVYLRPGEDRTVVYEGPKTPRTPRWVSSRRDLPPSVWLSE